VTRLVVALLACGVVLEQGQPPKPSFEVASIRPGTMGQYSISGGPGTSDPERLTSRTALRTILFKAYGVRNFQISASGSMDDRLGSVWDINAKVPPATVEQFNLMLQSLLEERFHLKLHHATKEFAAYNLVVAKGGLKLKDSVDITQQSNQTGIAKSANPDGGPASRSIRLSVEPGGRVLRGTALLADLAGILLSQVGETPVIDKTELTGTYDFRIEFTAAANPPPSDALFLSIFTALEKELGLKLEATNATFDVLVIDHIDSEPTEN